MQRGVYKRDAYTFAHSMYSGIYYIYDIYIHTYVYIHTRRHTWKRKKKIIFPICYQCSSDVMIARRYTLYGGRWRAHTQKKQRYAYAHMYYTYTYAYTHTRTRLLKHRAKYLIKNMYTAVLRIRTMTYGVYVPFKRVLKNASEKWDWKMELKNGSVQKALLAYTPYRYMYMPLRDGAVCDRRAYVLCTYTRGQDAACYLPPLRRWSIYLSIWR